MYRSRNGVKPAWYMRLGGYGQPLPQETIVFKILRQWMAERCDAFVAVGGQWWHEDHRQSWHPNRSGLAIQRGLPCFLLGGLGGAAGDYVRATPRL